MDKAAAKNTGLLYCMSPAQGEDVNDLQARAGLVPVVQMLVNVRLGGAHD